MPDASSVNGRPVRLGAAGDVLESVQVPRVIARSPFQARGNMPHRRIHGPFAFLGPCPAVPGRPSFDERDVIARLVCADHALQCADTIDRLPVGRYDDVSGLHAGTLRRTVVARIESFDLDAGDLRQLRCVRVGF